MTPHSAFRIPRSAFLLFALLVAVAVYGFGGADLQIARAIREWNAAHPGHGLRRLADWFGETGTLGLYPLAALALLVRAVWLRPNARIRRTCLWLLAAEALNGLAGLALKCTLSRWRPNQPLEGVFVFLHGFKPKCNSFPSGHTADVAAVAAVLWIVYPRLRPLYAAWVVAMAAARMGVMRHFLSDTALGAVLGIACALAARAWLPAIEARVAKAYRQFSCTQRTGGMAL